MDYTEIPTVVLEALEQIRSSAVTNMLDTKRVLEEVFFINNGEAFNWLHDHRLAWMEVLNGFGQWSSETKIYDGDKGEG